MSADSSAVMEQAPPPWWRRFHAALMPDYNRKASILWWTLVLIGAVVFVVSALQAATLSGSALLQLAGGTLLAMAMALVPLRIPRTNQSFTLGDVFIVLVLLMHGTPAGCVAAGLEGLVSSWRSSKRWTTRLGSATIATISMFVCGQLLQAAFVQLPFKGSEHAAELVLLTMAFGLMYSTCNAVLMSAVARAKRSEGLRMADLANVFGWVGAASAGASAVAGMLFITQRLAGFSLMLAILPLIGLLLATQHYYSCQQVAEEAARRAAARTLEREAELAISLARQREAEQATQHLRDLEKSENRFQSAFTHASIGMALVSRSGHIYQANPALRTLLGCDSVELEGRRFADHVADGDALRLATTLASVAAGDSVAMPIEFHCRQLDGTEVWSSISCSLFSKAPGEGPSLILQIQDVTARHRAELELHHRAFHDKLTGLANRERFNDVLTQTIQLDRRAGDDAFAVMFLDFDRFKLINDSKGHSVGDEFLVQASQRLLRCLRKGDLLARLGGDEFAILASGLRSNDDAEDLAERLLSSLREPLRLSSMDITATASIGITFSSIGYTRPEDMLRDADIAMYRAKAEGKARFALFDVCQHAEVANRVRLEHDLRQALAKRATTIAYQPLYDLNGGGLIGFEALSRWTHPELGPISPGSFIPIAEESGLITELTEFVILESCRQLRQWVIEHPGSSQLCIHVNVAARDLADVNFVSRVKGALLASGLAPRQLVVELTENILMAKLTAAMSTLSTLRELGVGLSVDDFGTGYSSLSHLAVLPIDSLKIDMSFVRNLRPGSNEAAVIRAIVLLAGSLGKHVIAEGIETQAQLSQLRELGCGYGQGFFLSRPLLAASVDKLLCAPSALPQTLGTGSETTVALGNPRLSLVH